MSRFARMTRISVNSRTALSCAGCREVVAPVGTGDASERAAGEEEGADDRGHEICRQMNAGRGIAPVARGRRYTPRSKSRCFTPVIATTGRTDRAGMHETGETRALPRARRALPLLSHGHPPPRRSVTASVREQPRRYGGRDDCSITDGAIRRRRQRAAAVRPSRQRLVIGGRRASRRALPGGTAAGAAGMHTPECSTIEAERRTSPTRPGVRARLPRASARGERVQRERPGAVACSDPVLEAATSAKR